MKCLQYFLCLICLSHSEIVLSQAIPSELADLSLQELMNLDINEDDELTDNSRWSFGYAYRKLEVSGYRTGTTDLSNETVLFRSSSGEARTNSNFPVLPTVITQEVHSFSLAYRLRDDLQLSVSVPYILQSTEHISAVPSFDEFTIDSEGVGDASISVGYTLPLETQGVWQVSSSISFPTGSITEKGDTPRNGPGTFEQLPYTMQLGSGTYDFPLSLAYNHRYEKFNYGAQLAAQIRTGKNSQGYRLGNSYSFLLWTRYKNNSWFHPGLKIDYRHTESIKGLDNDLTVPGPFPFPASITNPANYGGDKINLAASLRLCPTKDNCKQYIDVEYKKPVYMDVNGIQPQDDQSIAISAVIRF